MMSILKKKEQLKKILYLLISYDITPVNCEQFLLFLLSL